jgi:restriction system protein
MPIPTFDEFMLPVLGFMADGQTHKVPELTSLAADHFHLSTEEREATIPSEKQRIVYSRTTWAITYLSRAGLVERKTRGVYLITITGSQVLADPPPKLDKSWLRSFSPEFAEFAAGTKTKGTHTRTIPKDDNSAGVIEYDLSPEEAIQLSYDQIKETLVTDILEQVSRCSPHFFELLVIDVLVAMGYGGSHDDATQSLGGSGDQGIDGLINQDRLGLDTVYIQAKRWQNTVGGPDIRNFIGSLEGQRASKGVFVTTSGFSNDAKRFIEKTGKRIILIDGQTLAQLMIEYDVGMTPIKEYRLKKLDADYFDPEL